MTTLTDDFVDDIGAFWTETVGTVSVADSIATGSANPTKIVATTSQPVGAQQEAESYFAIGTTDDEGPELWVRLGTSGTDFVKGYGLRPTLLLGGATMTLKLFHAGAGETLTLLATSAVLVPVLAPSSAEDVMQHLRLVVFDRMNDSEAPEALETVIRGYLNEVRDDQPSIEFIHRGGLAGAPLPVWRDAGTYAIRFLDTTGSVDSWSARDDYVAPTYDVLPGDRSTLSAVYDQVVEKLTLGGLTNDNAAFIKRMILETCYGIVNKIGDKALFMERWAHMNLTSTAEFTVTLPRDVDRPIAIYDGATGYPIGFRGLALDERGRNILTLGRSPPTNVWIHYFGKVKPPVADTDRLPIPTAHDECVVHGTIMRFAGLENRRDLLEWSSVMYTEALDNLRQAMVNIRRTRRLHMKVAAPVGRGTPYGFGNIRASYDYRN